MAHVELPSTARNRLLDRFGTGARAWIDDFPAIVSELCRKWTLEPHTVHTGGTGAIIECAARVDGTRYALKLSPERTVTEEEAAALTYWAHAHTVVDLVDTDTTRSALLLEWLPDASTLTLDTGVDVEVTGLIADLFGRQRVPPSNVPSGRERVDFVFELWDRRRRALADPPISTEVWHRCHTAARDMAGDGDSLLHGDLHPGNILRVGDGRGIVAIDPRPCIGDPAMDLVDLAMTGTTSETQIRSRCRQLAGIADPIDADRIWSWCRSFAPLMAVSLARRDIGTDAVALMRNLATVR
ncbi:aminoglycoside phosphotransferase family protein [Arthrobacter castelli]|uniref:aminoglycoside phosphotransferase family protein n=1 Tax=Arthrobacter castelli TaxID=271431 RepID=UPI000687B85A|nr:aminoglycoside phosphotransferase family protein [Arthrobacter castelli]